MLGSAHQEVQAIPVGRFLVAFSASRTAERCWYYQRADGDKTSISPRGCVRLPCCCKSHLDCARHAPPILGYGVSSNRSASDTRRLFDFWHPGICDRSIPQRFLPSALSQHRKHLL